MKLLTVLGIFLCCFCGYAQQIDYDFGNNGATRIELRPEAVHETDFGVLLVDHNQAVALNIDGQLRNQFGADGSLAYPFTQNPADYITSSALLSDKLVLMGCSPNPSTQVIDLYITYHDIETGKTISESNYTYADTLDREYTASYADSDLQLFGYQYSSSTPFKTFKSTVELGTLEVSDIEIDAGNGSSLFYIPVNFTDLSNGKILAVYVQDVLLGGPAYYEIIDDISEVRTEGSSELLPWRNNWNLEAGSVEQSPSSLLIVKDFELRSLDLENDKEDAVQLDFMEENFEVHSIQSYNEQTFLVTGMLRNPNASDKLRLYLVENNLEVYEEIMTDGVFGTPLTGVTQIKAFTAGNFVYISIGLISGDSYLLRIEKELSSVSDSGVDSIAIHPSPASDIVYISGNKNNAFFSYQLYDMSGRKVQGGQLINNQISLVPSKGQYLLTLQSKDRILTKQILIE